MTKDKKDLPEYGDPETWGLTVDEYDNKVSSGLGDTWKIMRETADPEEQKELDDVELKSLKNKTIRFNKDVKEFRDLSGNKYSYKEKYKINSDVRKKASKIIKNPSQLNRFMTAPDFDSYKSTPKVKSVVIPKVNQEKPGDPDLDNSIEAIINKYQG
jgi:hypothetical protein